MWHNKIIHHWSTEQQTVRNLSRSYLPPVHLLSTRYRLSIALILQLLYWTVFPPRLFLPFHKKAIKLSQQRVFPFHLWKSLWNAPSKQRCWASEFNVSGDGQESFSAVALTCKAGDTTCFDAIQTRYWLLLMRHEASSALALASTSCFAQTKKQANAIA